MIVFVCHVCRTRLSVEDSQRGQLARCPTCRTAVRVPADAPTTAEAAAELSRSAAPSVGGRPFGFHCGYCSSRLEATEAMSGQEGQCPTCGNSITIPIKDRYGRLIDPKTRQIIKQDPHPVHAYAAAGDRAPAILRAADGTRTIRCSRCHAISPITADNCTNKSCGMPFTMEGTNADLSGAGNGFCVASLVLGIIGLVTFCLPLPAVLAIILGAIGYSQTSKEGADRRGRGLAIAGMILGGAGALIAVYFWGPRL